ncbi:hypothetical protein Sps_04992 [Shewanella psychrophila]|uniref:DUF4124 domain-containing protein n=1 Tax=Shewanella psychrophila TaxID=225848 RepID=A0A1S6HWX6_9GAMM|nr:hypothetical protein [Shewanella psychrophila]AQS40070.1 hypothetical protein Sps_04992 [Shewanella psychrophila]
MKLQLIILVGLVASCGMFSQVSQAKVYQCEVDGKWCFRITSVKL